jgi:alkanesulfonate monooxygenase SsuD/methylene tetrahydromethanopterin reductase-like flavin-dependent oxidoreductase (luciferase family)
MIAEPREAMNIGLHLPVMAPGFDRDRIFEWSRRIDAGPFSTLAVGERINFSNPEAMVTLTAAASVTSRVKLAFAVLVLPMHRPVLLAKQLATLDVLSAGRLSVGVGVGGRDEDYRAIGATWDHRLLRRLEDNVATMRRVWSGEIMTDGVARPVEPFPLQEGGPELMIGALFAQSIRRAARWADGLTSFSFGPTTDDVAEKFELARSAWREEGRAKPPRLVTGFWFALGSDADRQLESYLERYLAFMSPTAGRDLAPFCIARSPEGVRDALARCREAGADEVLLTPTTSDPDEILRLADAIA